MHRISRRCAVDQFGHDRKAIRFRGGCPRATGRTTGAARFSVTTHIGRALIPVSNPPFSPGLTSEFGVVVGHSGARIR